MNRTAISALLAFGLVSGLAFAGAARATDDKPDAKPTQASRMKTCNADAKEKSLKGAERKAFMSECLKKPKA